MCQLAGIALFSFRQPVYQFLLRVLFTYLVLFSSFAHNPASAQSTVNRQDVQNYVERLYAGTSGLHALGDLWHHNILDDPSVVPGLTWLDAFAFVIAADRVAASLERGDYAQAAQDSASFIVAFELTRQSTAFATMSSAFAIAGLAYLPIGWALDSFNAAMRDAAIAAQIEVYIEARSPRFNRSHEFIMHGVDDDEITFTTSPRGWIAVVGERQTQLWPQHGFTHEEVFGAARAIHDARNAVNGLSAERRLIEEAFDQYLRERAPQGPPTLVGSWAGIYHCSDRGDPTGRIEWTIRETDDGGLIVEENSYRNGRHEYEVYDVTLDQARDVYVGRSGNYLMEFRIQRVEHLISLDGTYIGYAPCDRFLVSPAAPSRIAAAPPAPGDKPLAGSWTGTFQCADRGSATGEVTWQITYDAERQGIFHVEEVRRRDGRSKKNTYRGQYDSERGHYTASRFAWHVSFSADSGYGALRGVYWPNTGGMFERCEGVELRRAG